MVLPHLLEKRGSTLTSREPNPQKFTICERKHTTPTKSRLFLVQKLPVEKYVSSLWATDKTGSRFEFETNGIRYVLILSETQAEIQPLGANANE
jgi:hypothetical protein